MRKISILCIIYAVTVTVFYISNLREREAQQKASQLVMEPIHIERLEKSILACLNKETIAELLQSYPLLLKQFWGIYNDTDIQMIADKLYTLHQHAAIQELHQDVADTFQDLSALTKELTHAFATLKRYYPDFTPPQIITIVTGMDADIYVSKELVVIGLDCFLGDNAKWRPQLPAYMLHTYQPNYIAAKVIAAVSDYFTTADGDDNTLLHDMLYQGKRYYFTKMLLPNLSEAMLLGYTPTQMEDTIEHKRIVWQHFIDHELLYTSDHMIKNKYLAPRPFTGEIGEGCPGNIGGWLGFEIIKKYMKRNSKVTLSELMKDKDTQNIFVKAKYKP